MPSSATVIARMDAKVRDLSDNVPRFLHIFEISPRFTGPSLYFHRRAIAYRQERGPSSAAIGSDEFVELLYATLTAWGMHRMGPGNTKLRDFEDIAKSLREHSAAIDSLDGLALSRLTERQLDVVALQVWQLLGALNISIAEAKLVANSKALHHILPALVPPIDRTYTFNFFYDRTALCITEQSAFREMFARFHQIAVRNSGIIQGIVGSGWHTSETKVLDNAIVGYAIGALGVQPIGL